jgi:hypothetical protein
MDGGGHDHSILGRRVMHAAIFDLWDTLAPLPTAVGAAVITRLAKMLELPADDFRLAWSASWSQRATGPFKAVLCDIVLELTGRPASDERVEEAIRVWRELFRSPHDSNAPNCRSMLKSSRTAQCSRIFPSTTR